MAKKTKTIEQKIDDLAAMTARGFEQVVTKELLKENLASMEKRLTDRLDRI